MPRKSKTRKQKGGKLCRADFNNSKPYPSNSAINAKDIYTLGDEFPSSGDWFLYEAKDMPSLLIKKVGGWKEKEDIEREFHIARVAGDMKIGPLILFSRICFDSKSNPVGYLVMEKIEGHTISTPDEIAAANELLGEFNGNGFTHGDTHLKNAMWGTTASNPNPRAWIIDFGEAKEEPPRHLEKFTDD